MGREGKRRMRRRKVHGGETSAEDGTGLWMGDCCGLSPSTLRGQEPFEPALGWLRLMFVTWLLLCVFCTDCF